MDNNNKKQTVAHLKQLQKRLKHLLRLGWINHGNWGEVARLKKKLRKMKNDS